jgi:hypothetical protein
MGDFDSVRFCSVAFSVAHRPALIATEQMIYADQQFTAQ